MNADIITDISFPHGTPEGFRSGCHGSHCPSVIPCRDVYLRYVGDWGFRRRLDAGETASQVVAWEREQAEEAARAAKEAREAAIRDAARERHNKARRTAQKSFAKKGDGIPRTDLQIEVHRLHGEGLTDREIADAIGTKTRVQVKSIRTYLTLAPNLKPTAVPRVTELIEQGKDDRSIADMLGLSHRYVAAIRRNNAASAQGYGGGA